MHLTPDAHTFDGLDADVIAIATVFDDWSFATVVRPGLSDGEYVDVARWLTHRLTMFARGDGEYDAPWRRIEGGHQLYARRFAVEEV